MLCCVVVWCGVVWCGVVWCGVVWCGVVCCWLAAHLLPAVRLRSEWLANTLPAVLAVLQAHVNDEELSFVVLCFLLPHDLNKRLLDNFNLHELENSLPPFNRLNILLVLVKDLPHALRLTPQWPNDLLISMTHVSRPEKLLLV